MVEPKTIVTFGNLMKIIMADGTSRLAYPTGNDLWNVKFLVPPPPPPPPPTPTSRFIWPFDLGSVTSEFGPREPYPFHNGIDFGQNQGTPIPIMGAGTVTVSQAWQGTQSGMDALGNYLRVSHGVLFGHELLTGYAHMSSPPNFAVGQTVSQNEIAGMVDTTGFSTGPHLHLETWDQGTRINPRDWMNAYANL